MREYNYYRQVDYMFQFAFYLEYKYREKKK